LRGVAGNVPGVCTPPPADTTTTPGQNLATEGVPAIGGDQLPPTGEQAPEGGEVPPETPQGGEVPTEAPPEPADQAPDGGGDRVQTFFFLL
jgi:hypothetical protein